MADKRIKGITIEIGGDTVGLDKALKDVNKQSNSLKSELKDVERLLKFDPGNAEAAAQKQKLLADQINVTAERLQYLKDAQKEVEAQFQKGSISEQQYRNFRREIEFTEGSLKKLKSSLGQVNAGSPLKDMAKDAEEAKGSVNELGGELAGLAGGLAAGGGIAGAISTALDSSSLDTKIDIQFEVPEESKQSVKKAVKDIEAYGVDAESALEGVRRQWALNKDASDAVNDTVVRGAGAISAAFSGVDFTELIQETNEIASGLDISNENALGLVDSLLKAGFPPEQLDTIAEYGQQMKDAGFSAAEIQSIFEAGIDTKTWNIDNLNDGVKEARIQMATFGLEIPKAMKPLLKDAGISSKKFQDWGKAVAEGGEKGSEAMSEMVTWLNGIEDQTLKNELATKVFGTKWEDQGQNMISVFQGLSGAVDKTAENTNGLYETMGKVNSDPAVELEQAFNRLKEALQPLLTKIAELVSKLAGWMAENPKLAATITTVIVAIGIITGMCMALVPIILTLTGAAATLGVSLGAILLPIGLVVAGIVALIAIGVLLWKNWDTIKAKSIEIWDSIKTFLSQAWEGIKSTASTVWNAIKSFFSSTWEGIKSLFNSAVSGISNFLKQRWENIKNNTSTIFNAVKTFISNTWSGIKSTVSSFVEGIKNAVRDKFESLKNAVQDKMNSVKKKIEEIWGKVKNFLGDIDLMGIGKDIIQGLIDGIASKAGALMKKATDIANSIKKTIKGALDINSPSRVMRDEIGKWIPEGVAAGIEGNMKSINRAVDKMSEATMPTLPNTKDSSGGQVQSGDTFAFDGMFSGAQFIIREEADIDRIADKLYQKQRRAARSMGVVRR
jgi:phage-related minor tail protein